jgi:hypothetical protein
MRIVPALLAALAAPAAAQDARALDIRPEQARTLPPAEAAEIVFRQLASEMAAMTRPDPRDRGPLRELVFATAPRAFGDPGLCVATLVHVGIDRPDTSYSMAEPGLFVTQRVYKVIGDVQPRGEWDEASRAEQARLCERAGPAISPDADDKGRAFFFTTSGHALPTAPVAALQTAIAAARAGEYREIGCEDIDADEDAPSRCSGPVKLFADLDLANLTSIDMTAPRESESIVRVEARFAVSPDSFWMVTHEAVVRPDTEGGRIFRPVRTRLAAGRIFDISEPALD